MVKLVLRAARVRRAGCGKVSQQYLRSIARIHELDFTTRADLVHVNAEAVAEEFEFRKSTTVEGFLGEPELYLVPSFTLSASHAHVSLGALAGGNRVHTEKPIAVTFDDATATVAETGRHKRRIGNAPDTLVGAGRTPCAELAQSSAIGKPIGVSAFKVDDGPHALHPQPEILLFPGEAPRFHIGPYCLNTLVAMFGAITRVCGCATIPRTERTILTREIVEAPLRGGSATHVASLLAFENGVVGTRATSFNAAGARTPSLKLNGAARSIDTRPANRWADPALVKGTADSGVVEVPTPEGDAVGFKEMRLIDIAASLRTVHAPAPTAARAIYVLEVMSATLDSIARVGTFVDITLRDHNICRTHASRGAA